jgi:hypothetical protein
MMKFKRTINYIMVKSKTILKNLKRSEYFELFKDNYFLINFTLSD